MDFIFDSRHTHILLHTVPRLTEPNHIVVDVLFRCSFHHTIQLPYWGKAFGVAPWMRNDNRYVCVSSETFLLRFCVFLVYVYDELNPTYILFLFSSSTTFLSLSPKFERSVYHLMAVRFWFFLQSMLKYSIYFSFLSVMKSKANERNLSRPITENHFIAIDYSTCSQCTFYKQHTT